LAISNSVVKPWLKSTSPITAIRKVFDILKLVAGSPTDEDSTADPNAIGKNGAVVLTEITKDTQTMPINNRIILKSILYYLELL